MNGKGDKIRKGANLALYWENYDKIFRKKDRAIKKIEPSTITDNKPKCCGKGCCQND
jgi:hypothetical protein